jgi:phosphinothricin acetyltransferase
MAVLIRLAGPADAAAIAAIYRPYVERSRISFEEKAPDADEIARRMRGDTPGRYPWLVAEEDGGLVGFASSSPFRSRPAYRWVIETGVYLEPEVAGRGIGRVLLSRMMELLERQGYVSAIGAIALPNAASVALHEALGFVQTGTYRAVGFKLGEWIDVGLWQRDLAPRSAQPAEPEPYAEVASIAGLANSG